MNKKLLNIAMTLLLITGCTHRYTPVTEQDPPPPKAKVIIQKPRTKGLSQVGKASFYANYFHGRLTANGSIFDQHSYTAAHKELPMPSVVKVTNLDNKKSVYVLITDRGPFRRNRIVDLSSKAAKHIGIIQKGIVNVKLEYLPKETEKFLAKVPAYKTSLIAFNEMVKNHMYQLNHTIN